VHVCRVADGSVWYAMPQGERRGSEVDLYDLTYDGAVQDGYLSGGMGQLSDREVGHTNFRLDPHNNNIKGYEWMGWRNETFLGKPVEILYKFDTVRNFSVVKIHSNNFFSKVIAAMLLI
jgi:discoidin domain receptor family protein 2